MPRIPTYNNDAFPNASPVADQARSAATAGYYRANMIRQGFNALEQGTNQVQRNYEKRQKDAEDQKAKQEIVDYTVKAARLEADVAVQWANTDQGAPGAADAHVDDLNKGLSGLNEGLTTQDARNHAAINSANVYGSNYLSAHVDASNAQAASAVQKVSEIETSYSNMVATNPANLETAVEHYNVALDGIAEQFPGMKGVKLDAMKKSAIETLAKTAALSTIDRIPGQFTKDLAAGRYNGLLQGDDEIALKNQDDAAINSAEQDKSVNENAVMRAKKAEGVSKINELESSVIFDSTTGKATVPPNYHKELGKLRGQYGDVLDPGTFTAASNWAITEVRRKETDKAVKTDPTTFNNLAALDMAGKLTIKDVKEASTSGMLSTTDYKYFFSHTQTKTPDSGDKAQVNRIIKGAEKFITNSLGGLYTDTWGTSRTTDFAGDMLRKWDEMKTAGKTTEDFFTYVNKSYKDYRFTPADMEKAVTNLDELGEPVDIPADINAPAEGGSIKDFFDKAPIYTPSKPVTSNGNTLPIISAQDPHRQTLSLAHMNPAVLSAWEQVQGAMGVQMPIVSGYRNPETNAAAGGAKKSQHMSGNAIDIRPVGLSTREKVRLIQTASSLGFTGIGVGGGSIHFDMRSSGRATWGYDAWGRDTTVIPLWARDVIDSHMAGKFAGAK